MLKIRMNENSAMCALAALRTAIDGALRAGMCENDESIMCAKKAAYAIMQALKADGHETLIAFLQGEFPGFGKGDNCGK